MYKYKKCSFVEISVNLDNNAQFGRLLSNSQSYWYVGKYPKIKRINKSSLAAELNLPIKEIIRWINPNIIYKLLRDDGKEILEYIIDCGGIREVILSIEDNEKDLEILCNESNEIYSKLQNMKNIMNELVLHVEMFRSYNEIQNQVLLFYNCR